MTALRSPISRRLQKFRNAVEGLQSWKPNREEKARKLLKGERANWGTHLFSKTKKKQTANGNQGNFFVLVLLLLSCLQKKIHASLKIIHFCVQKHKSNYKALQGVGASFRVQNDQKLDLRALEYNIGQYLHDSKLAWTPCK